MLEKKVVSRRLPFWISVVDGKFQLNQKVSWVRKAYEMAADGYGLVKIQKHFARNNRWAKEGPHALISPTNIPVLRGRYRCW